MSCAKLTLLDTNLECVVLTINPRLLEISQEFDDPDVAKYSVIPADGLKYHFLPFVKLDWSSYTPSKRPDGSEIVRVLQTIHG
jgi:hypothetical protein